MDECEFGWTGAEEEPGVCIFDGGSGSSEPL